jgi:hypothetical protein
MYCRKCEYPLRGITARACPECATSFDPADPGTTLRSPRSATPWMRRLRHALWIVNLPVAVNTLAAVACWVIATIQLGRTPQTSMDDPKGLALGPFVGVWERTGSAAVLSIPALVLVWIVLAGWPGTRSAKQRSMFLIGVSFAAFILEFMVFMLVGGWLAD